MTKIYILPSFSPADKYVQLIVELYSKHNHFFTRGRQILKQATLASPPLEWIFSLQLPTGNLG